MRLSPLLSRVPGTRPLPYRPSFSRTRRLASTAASAASAVAAAGRVAPCAIGSALTPWSTRKTAGRCLLPTAWVSEILQLSREAHPVACLTLDRYSHVMPEMSEQTAAAMDAALEADDEAAQQEAR